MTNLDATKSSEVVILAVKYQFAIQTIQSVAEALDAKVVVTPIVPMSKQKLCAYTPPEQGSAAKHICSVMPQEIRTVVAFQTLPAPRLADLNDPLGFDVIVCADDEEAKKLVMSLVADLGNVAPARRRRPGGGEARGVPDPLLINLA